MNSDLSQSIPEMLTVKQPSERFGIAQHYARQLALSGKIKAVRVGNKILIDQGSLTEYFNSNCLVQSQDHGINSSVFSIK